MALSRFVRSKSSLPIYRIGVSMARTRRFSSAYGENEKPTQLMEEAKRVEPAAKENEVGGPWRSLKNILHNLKDTMLRPNHSQNDHSTDASTPSVAPSASMATASRDVPVHVNAEVQDSELILQSQHAEKSHENMNGDNGASGIARHSSSAEVVEEASSEVNEIQYPFQFPKTEEADDLDMKSVPIVLASHNSAEKCCDEVLDLNYPEVSEQGKGSDEVSSSSSLDLDRCLASNLENLSSSHPPGLAEESSIAESIVASTPGLTGSGKVEWRELKEVVMAMRGSSKKAKRLTNLFREKSYDETEHLAGYEEGTKPEASLSDVLLNLPEDVNFQFDRLLASEATSDLQDGHTTKLPSNKFENNPQEYEKLSCEGAEMSSPSYPTQKLLDLYDFCIKSANPQEAEEFPEQKSRLDTFEHSENSNTPFREDEENKGDIMGLIDFLRQQEHVPSNTTSDSCNSDIVPERSLNMNLRKFDNKNLTSDNYPTANSGLEDEKTVSLDSEPIDLPDLKASLKVSVSRKSKDHKSLQAEKGSEENKVLVRFLRSIVTKTHITQALSVCGNILKVEIDDVRGPLMKVASVYFETSEAVQKALKTIQFVSGGVVIVESATSKEKMTEKIQIPSLIGDPNVPTALVKNPTRTVKIENLTNSISSHHIEEILALSEINISGYFLGSSSSVAYVEFETETAKEKALAKHCINVLGRNLVMLRIDAPRTTVVRISNIQSIPLTSVSTVCKSLGDVRLCVQRGADIVDMGFVLAEWPNMLNILNRLNGSVVEDRQLKAEPAPVFPPDVLLALWDQPKGRKYVKATMQDLLHKLGSQATGISEVAHMVDEFVDEI